MATVTYDKDLTALLVIDPYNDFISEGGKLWGYPFRRLRLVEGEGASRPASRLALDVG